MTFTGLLTCIPLYRQMHPIDVTVHKWPHLKSWKSDLNHYYALRIFRPISLYTNEETNKNVYLDLETLLKNLAIQVWQTLDGSSGPLDSSIFPRELLIGQVKFWCLRLLPMGPLMYLERWWWNSCLWTE